MKKKQLLIGGGIAVILLLLFGVWNLWFSATKVAFINYQVISLGQISKANDNVRKYKRRPMVVYRY
mgnify:CR=1 FL=1